MRTSVCEVSAPAGANVLAEVLARPDVWRGDRLASAPLPAVASGHAALDAELPGGGWPRGALTELLVDGPGLGELSLLLPALAAVRGEGGWSLVVGAPYPLHAPAWSAAGVDLARLGGGSAAGGAAAFLFRPAHAAAEASAAPLRLALAAGPAGKLAVSILKRRGPSLAAPLCLDLPRPVRHHEAALAGPRPAPAAARSPFQTAWA